MLRIYDLEGYRDRKFNSVEEIEEEARENLKKAEELAKTSKKAMIGRVWMKRPDKDNDHIDFFSTSFFASKNQQ